LKTLPDRARPGRPQGSRPFGLLRWARPLEHRVRGVVPEPHGFTRAKPSRPRAVGVSESIACRPIPTGRAALRPGARLWQPQAATREQGALARKGLGGILVRPQSPTGRNRPRFSAHRGPPNLQKFRPQGPAARRAIRGLCARGPGRTTTPRDPAARDFYLARPTFTRQPARVPRPGGDRPALRSFPGLNRPALSAVFFLGRPAHRHPGRALPLFRPLALRLFFVAPRNWAPAPIPAPRRAPSSLVGPVPLRWPARPWPPAAGVGPRAWLSIPDLRARAVSSWLGLNLFSSAFIVACSAFDARPRLPYGGTGPNWNSALGGRNRVRSRTAVALMAPRGSPGGGAGPSSPSGAGPVSREFRVPPAAGEIHNRRVRAHSTGPRPARKGRLDGLHQSLGKLLGMWHVGTSPSDATFRGGRLGRGRPNALQSPIFVGPSNRAETSWMAGGRRARNLWVRTARRPCRANAFRFCYFQPRANHESLTRASQEWLGIFFLTARVGNGRPLVKPAAVAIGDWPPAGRFFESGPPSTITAGPPPESGRQRRCLGSRDPGRAREPLLMSAISRGGIEVRSGGGYGACS